jgi:acylphosphatase
MAGGDVPTTARLTAWVSGRVQGVGFRWWVRANALELALAGFAENLADGRVKVVAEGAEDRCRDLLSRLEDDSGGYRSGPERPAGLRLLARPGRVTGVAHRWSAATGDVAGFTEL